METDPKVLYDFILDYSNDGFFDWPIGDNPDYEYLSPRFKEILGYKDHEMENKPSSWQNLVFPEDMEKLSVALEEHFKTNKPFKDEGVSRATTNFLIKPYVPLRTHIKTRNAYTLTIDKQTN